MRYYRTILAYKSQHNENDYPDNHLDYNTPPQVCPSCRAFFRRSVQSGYNATYFCVKDGSCQVDDFDNFDVRYIGSGICVDGRVDDDIYIMMKCVFVCLSRKMSTSSWESLVTT